MRGPATKVPWNQVLTGSVQGADHRLEGLICQDAVSVKEGFFRGEPFLICSAADGHGHHDYEFSDRGAMLALQAAEQTFSQLVLALSTNPRRYAKRYGTFIQDNLKSMWIENIRRHFRVYSASTNLIRKHGTTILAVLIYRGFVYMAQLGDGVICLLDWNDRAEFVDTPEMGPIENAADSLCGENANACWKFAWASARNVKALMLSTDGLVNSMATNEGFVEFVKTLERRSSDVNSRLLQNALSDWLDQYSDEGSGDDSTVAMITMKPTKENKGEDHE